MGPPTLCDHCGKKFKVFAKRRKCTHCQTLLCRHCYEPHQFARHANAGAESSSWLVDDDEIHFQSPMHAAGSSNSLASSNSSSFSTVASAGGSEKKAARSKIESEVDLFDDLDVVEVEENDDDDDEDGANQDDLLLGAYGRRASMEEEENQFREFTQLQYAIEKWTRKEIEIKKQQRLAKQSNLIYATKPVQNFGSTREYQQRELFSISYAVFVTLLVWIIFAVSMSLYVRVVESTLTSSL